MMRAGQLRHRVKLQKLVKSKSSVGKVTETWPTQATVWAAIWPLRGQEYFAADQTQSKVSTRIRIRYGPQGANITPEWRVANQAGTRTWNVRDIINPDEKNEYLDLMCEETVT